MDVRQAIHTQPMKRLQIVTVAIAIAITMIDGYEILVMAFVAPALSREWGIGPVQVGYLLSAGIFGMTAGATCLSPLADRFGRRRYILASLLLIVVGMGLSAVAQNVAQLLAFRAFAGLFLGGIVASINILVAEYCSDRRRILRRRPAGAELADAQHPMHRTRAARAAAADPILDSRAAGYTDRPASRTSRAAYRDTSV